MKIETEKMRNLIIPIFVIYKGCPNRCVYCNERITAGNHPGRISKEHFRTIVNAHLDTAGQKADYIQIAFYGGNFTGIERNYQAELLELAGDYIKTGTVHSIRISTRPDYIDENKIQFLKEYPVRTIETGAQSMVDEVLTLSNRGHSSKDVRNAVRLLKQNGFETGVHLMAGLPGDSSERFRYTVEETIKLRPHMVRIHPTIVFRNTLLANYFLKGEYKPLSMHEAIELCKYALIRFKQENIAVIRLGLQQTEDMVEGESIIAGPCHPAFRSLVEGSIFLDMASHLLKNTQTLDRDATFFISPKSISNFRGIKNGNISALKERFKGLKITIKEDPLQKRESLALAVKGKRKETSFTNMI